MNNKEIARKILEIVLKDLENLENSKKK